jgi:hypothetical protein
MTNSAICFSNSCNYTAILTCYHAKISSYASHAQAFKDVRTRVCEFPAALTASNGGYRAGQPAKIRRTEETDTG